MKDLSLSFLTAIRRKVCMGTKPAARNNDSGGSSQIMCFVK